MSKLKDWADENGEADDWDYDEILSAAKLLGSRCNLCIGFVHKYRFYRGFMDRT